MKPVKVAWGITGAGHHMRECYRVFKEGKDMGGLKINIFVSSSGEEVLRMYGLLPKLREISRGEYMEEIFFEREQGASFPKAGRFLLKKHDAFIVAPTTSNTVAKIAHGIADSLITNSVAQAVKGGVPLYILPVDISGSLSSEMPYMIDREICRQCEVCPPREICPTGAITDQIDLLKCTGCGDCVDLCEYDAILGGFVELKVRDIDAKNVEVLRSMEGIKVLRGPEDIGELLKKLQGKIRAVK